MCGFSGFVDLAGDSDPPEIRHALLRRMGEQLSRRGPDDEQIHCDTHLSLVFRRLSIVDMDHGRQPIWNEDSTVMVVVNGEIYNHQELRRQLEPKHRFRSHSDCEVVLHLYEEEGPAALKKLNGMFAIALWDTRARRLFLARDRLGIKPLFYSRSGTRLFFGSEMKALTVHPECPNRFDWSGAGDSFQAIYGKLNTFVQGIDVLPGGHFLVHSEGASGKPTRYWRLEDSFDSGDFRLSKAECIERYAELIQDSVKLQLLGEAKIGIFLSGGLDSSVITGLAAPLMEQTDTFSILERSVLSTGDPFRADSISKRFNTRHHPVLFDHNRILDQLSFSLRTFEYFIWMMELPMFGIEFLLKHELHRYAKSRFPELKVILIGQGADEFCGGYSKQYGGAGPQPKDIWSHYVEAMERSLRRASLLREGIPASLSPFVSDGYLLSRTETFGPRFPSWDPGLKTTPTQRNFVGSVVRLQNYNLWHEDRTSSSQGIESRVPFLDHRLVEFLASIPESLQAELFTDKQIARDAAARWLGPVATRQPKVGLVISNEMSSVEHLLHGIVRRIFREFDESYLADSNSMFSRQAVGTLFKQVDREYGRGAAGTGMDLLLTIMSVSVFDRMLRRRGRDTPLGELKPLSPLRTEPRLSLDLWEDSMTPRLEAWWKPETSVAITPGIIFLESMAGQIRPQGLFALRGNTVVGKFEPDPALPWLARVLQVLSGSTAPLPVADLSKALNVPVSQLPAGLTNLFRAGWIIAP